MTPEECREVLATVAGYDGRTVDRHTILKWHAIIGPIPHNLADAAVVAWYGENSGYIQPHDVGVMAARLSGLADVDTVTRRRLEGRALPWAQQGLGAAWLPGKHDGNERQDNDEPIH